MDENEIYVLKEYKFDNPLITEIDSIVDKCFRVCYNNFHNFKYRCIYDIKLKIITSNGIIILLNSDESMHLYEKNKKITIAWEKGFRFLQINKLTLKFYSHLRYINISNYLKSQKPMCHRQFFRVISQNRV